MLSSFSKMLTSTLVLGLLIFGTGCKPEPEITAYTVPKVAQPKNPPLETPVAPQGQNQTKRRLLGAIIPVGENSSYFVKFSGKFEEITKFEKDFDTFLNTIRITKDAAKPAVWAVPDGWVDIGAKTLRIVTLKPKSGEDVELYLSAPFGGNLLDNVNRWRGEVGQSSVTETDLPANTKEILLGETKAYRVDFSGMAGDKAGMPPFMRK